MHIKYVLYITLYVWLLFKTLNGKDMFSHPHLYCNINFQEKRTSQSFKKVCNCQSDVLDYIVNTIYHGKNDVKG